MIGSHSLAISKLSGGYGDITVIRDVSLTVEPGKVVFVTGRNGVGKTTLIKLIAGQLAAQSGHIIFGERDMRAEPPHARRAIGIGYAPQESVVFDDLSVRENLTLQYRDRDLARYEALFVSFPRLKERRAQRAGTLSGGEKKILSFCRAVAEDTRLVMLDEPTEGVQPENIERMARHVATEAGKGRGFLVVEQNLGFAERLADHAHVLDHGVCVFDMPGGPGLRARLAEKLAL
ncbi:ATP-binding cassette domain-containing protein [Hoeflea sp. CAU 1731]